MERHDTGLFLSVFSPIKIQQDSKLKDRKFIDIPKTIIDLDNEKGVSYITYNFETNCCCEGPAFSQVFFQPTTPQKSWILQLSPFTKAKPDRPYFYRIGDTVSDGVTDAKVNRIYFLGIECVDVKDVEIGLMIGLDPTDVCDLDEEVPVPDSLIQTLITEVLNLGRFAFLVPKDRANDGFDTAVPSQQAAVTTPQRPAQIEEE